MRKFLAIVTLLVLLPTAARTAEQPVQSRIASVGLFKNGLAVVQRFVVVPGPGTYRVDDVPEPIHGTFWIESDAKVVTQLARKLVEAPARRTPMVDYQEELAGKEVMVHFTDPGIPPTSGTVVEMPPPSGEDAWNRNYQPSGYYYAYDAGRQLLANSMLVLQTPKGRSYIAPAKIAYLEAKGAGNTAKRRMPVLMFKVSESGQAGAKKEATITITYLTKGIGWAPSYQVDLSDPKSLVLRQQAVIKNELTQLEDTEIQLISGFPSIQFANVTSPMSLRNTWATFFQQLNQPVRAGSSVLSNTISQQRIGYGHGGQEMSADLSAVPTGEGVDLHYQSIGKQTLGEGDSLSMEVASARAGYASIIEWLIPDTRNPYGHYISPSERDADPDKYQDAAWDAVRFKNPLPFPMTTAPAMIVCKGRFNGQQTSHWVNSGEETTLRVTKALSIRTRSIEQEEKGERDIVFVGSAEHRRVTVKGELTANNHRKEPVDLVIRRCFSGDLLEADKSPKTMLLEEGVYSVNKRNELIWNLRLGPGEEVSLKYRYTVLVRN